MEEENRSKSQVKEQVRVLRIIEYVGDRDEVEATVRKSIQGEMQVRSKNGRATLTIRAATIGAYPEILEPKEEKENV